MKEIHGILPVVPAGQDMSPEAEEETVRIIDELHERITAILNQGLIVRLERGSWEFNQPVIKFLDSWTPCYEKQDLVAVEGIRASTLYVCPIYVYAVSGVTKEEMEAEILADKSGVPGMLTIREGEKQ